jgi:hypothetical protein
VNETAVLAIKELGISLATPAVAGLLEDVMLITIAREHTVVALAFDRESIVLHDRLEVDAQVDIFLHSHKYFLYTKRVSRFKIQDSKGLSVEAGEELADGRSNGLGLAGRERMDVADLDDVSLEPAKNWLGEWFQTVTLQVVKERDAQFFLIRSLD